MLCILDVFCLYISKKKKKQMWQCTYQHNIEGCSCIHCSRRKIIIITYFDCVLVS